MVQSSLFQASVQLLCNTVDSSITLPLGPPDQFSLVPSRLSGMHLAGVASQSLTRYEPALAVTALEHLLLPLFGQTRRPAHDVVPQLPEVRLSQINQECVLTLPLGGLLG